MTFTEFYQTLEKNKYYVFSFEDIVSFFPGEKKSSLKKIVYRWKLKNLISALKRGLYELSYPKNLVIPDFYIANRMYSPSYISLETALSNYSIIPEVSMAVTSITTKPTRKFKNSHGLFMYHTIKPEAFNGYYAEKHGIFDVLIAEPEKAVIDYLYFKSYDKKFSFEEERLDKNILSKLRKVKLQKYAKQYNIDLKEFYAYL